MGMYILWIYGSKKEGIKMKKIISIIILLLSFSLSSCFEKKIDPTWYGSSYGYSQVIDGLEVCLRTDGYYQIVGVKEEAIKNGVLIIPQYINGIPVMGFGVNNYLVESVYYFIYQKNNSFSLESSWIDTTCQRNSLNKVLFDYDENSLKSKAYINCHHINFHANAIDNSIYCYLPFYKIIFNFDWEEAFGDLMDPFFYMENDSELAFWLSEKLQQYPDKDKETLLLERCGSSEPIDYRYCIYNTDGSSKKNNFRIVMCYDTYMNKKAVYDSLYYKYIEYLALNRVHKAKLKCKNRDTDIIKEDGVEMNVNSQEYYDYIYNKILNELKEPIHFDVLCANVEFHYNLIIDGDEYHDYVHPHNDLYWIDHLGDGEILNKPPVPFVEGYTFLGWYTDPECTNCYSFNKPVQDIQDELVWLKLYAKWQ